MVELLQRVAGALVQDVVEVEDEHDDHALLVLHRDDVGDAQEVRAWRDRKWNIGRRLGTWARFCRGLNTYNMKTYKNAIQKRKIASF